ncbi:hypothetical protein GPJ56_009263 [Histomonas meleagridis]|uniref:uncharacterized protein n=1 Tax=Histomonas meleagridis TaxID=135588 RepID=UPI00355AAA18|nr:hypothetical protein GPJ56_009263 [Histomonas meleagridis]KAH0801634.1 hypothetical protein GO595_005633 [Histomonas meleagridis]
MYPSPYAQVDNFTTFHQEKFFSKYPIPIEQEKLYANLFSILIAVEQIENEYCEGNISSEEHSQFFDDLNSQFSRLLATLNLGKNDVESFCKACQTNVPYAIAALFSDFKGSGDSGKSNANFQDAFDLGTDFATLSDLCHLGIQDATQYINIITKIQGRLMRIGILQTKQEVKDLTDKWRDKFAQYKPQDKVETSVIEQLKSDLLVWKTLSMEQ